jgi:hypothetical protein
MKIFATVGCSVNADLEAEVRGASAAFTGRLEKRLGRPLA